MSQDTNAAHQPTVPAGNPVQPEWLPPAWLDSPYVNRADVERAIWVRNVREARIPRTTALVAHTLASYGDKSGANCFPGNQRIADVLVASIRTVERAMAWLAEEGWIRLVHRGARKSGEANVWQLTIPAPLAATLHVRSRGRHRKWLWTLESGPQWIERPEWATTKERRRGRSGRFLPDNRDRSTRHGSPVLPVTDGGTPGESHQGVKGHQSEVDSRPHADARGRTSHPPADEERSWLSLDNIDLAEDICDEVGEMPGVRDVVERMILEGRHPMWILNAAYKVAGRW